MLFTWKFVSKYDVSDRSSEIKIPLATTPRHIFHVVHSTKNFFYKFEKSSVNDRIFGAPK
jgi:hypothetical protein